MERSLSRLNESNYVPETRFGIWFLGTQIWVQFVLEAAVADLLDRKSVV